MYLGQSPLHNHDAALFLNRNSSLVIPQLCVWYDPLFTTNKEFDSSSLWQVRAGFFNKQETPPVALIGQPNVKHFPPTPLHKRQANMFNWIHWPLLANLSQRETIVASLNKRETLIHIYLHKRDHPVMKILLNQGGHPNLMRIYLNKRNHPIMKLTINKRGHLQTIL